MRFKYIANVSDSDIECYDKYLIFLISSVDGMVYGGTETIYFKSFYKNKKFIAKIEIAKTITSLVLL